MNRLTPEQIEAIARLRAKGLGSRRIARMLNIHGATVASRIWRTEHAELERQRMRDRTAARRREQGTPITKGSWDEARLTETWEQRKARRAREKAAKA